MFILFGTRGVAYTKGAGEFTCPACNAEREYKHIRIRQFFTLFFIPVIPLMLRGEFVECKTCSNKFKLDVLELKGQGNTRISALRVAQLSVFSELHLKNRTAAEDEINDFCLEFHEFCGEGISFNEMKEGLKALKDKKNLEILTQCSKDLDNISKENVLLTAYRIEQSRGDFDLNIIKKIGESLQMTPAHIKGVVDTAQQGSYS